MPKKKTVDNGQVLKYLSDKYYYEKNAINGCVFRLSYAGKFIIVKGKTLSGALFAIHKAFTWFSDKNVDKNNIYKHFYKHILENPNGRFRLKILSKSKRPYFLLKREQMELDKHEFNPLMLNNSKEAYIPNFNPLTDMYGWISQTDVLAFKRYLRSKKRKVLRKLNGSSQAQAPANCA